MLQLGQPRRQVGVLGTQLLVGRGQVGMLGSQLLVRPGQLLVRCGQVGVLGGQARQPRLQSPGVLDQLPAGQVVQARHMIIKTGLGQNASTDTPCRSPHAGITHRDGPPRTGHDQRIP